METEGIFIFANALNIYSSVRVFNQGDPKVTLQILIHISGRLV